MTTIKICGIKTEEHAVMVAESKADFIGFVFSTSPRQVSPSQAKNMAAAAKSSHPNIQTVGVFVNTPVKTMAKIADSCQFDWVQLSGDEPWAVCRELARPVIKVFRVSRTFRPADVVNHVSHLNSLLGDQKHMFLLDSNSRDKFGGTGLSFDWKLAQPVAEKFPVIVAGGLSSENVGLAIETIKPWGVDVSSGVERIPGNKDSDRIKNFISTVRNKDVQLSG